MEWPSLAHTTHKRTLRRRASRRCDKDEADLGNMHDGAGNRADASRSGRHQQQSWSERAARARVHQHEEEASGEQRGGDIGRRGRGHPWRLRATRVQQRGAGAWARWAARSQSKARSKEQEAARRQT